MLVGRNVFSLGAQAVGASRAAKHVFLRAKFSKAYSILEKGARSLDECVEGFAVTRHWLRRHMNLTAGLVVVQLHRKRQIAQRDFVEDAEGRVHVHWWIVVVSGGGAGVVDTNADGWWKKIDGRLLRL